MSKLRADITWNHCINSNISPPIPFISNFEEENINNNEKETEENLEDNEDLLKEKLDDDEKEEDEDSAIMEEEFGKYLQGWAEMLQEEIFQEYEDDDDDIEYVEINNITHPAIDSNAKWKLNSLFKKLQFPF